MVTNRVQESEDISYQKRLAIRLKKIFSLSSGKLLFLTDYVRESLGAFPTDVMLVLDKNSIPYSIKPREDSPRQVLTEQLIKNTSFLADEHPNDFDWRFSPNTIDSLVKRVNQFPEISQRVALLGVKTLLPLLIDQGVKSVLYERSPSLIQDFSQKGYSTSVIEHDLLYPLYNGQFTYTLVIADPPWYLDYYKAYLDRSAELLSIGGEVWLSVLPALTRPSALVDRRAIRLFASQRGFQLIKKTTSLLAYQTPTFERQSLAVSGVDIESWRLGDLWVFRKTSHSLIAPSLPLSLNQAAWTEYRIGNKKVQIRKEVNNGSKCFDYRPTSSKGKFFDSVSRRATERNHITIWTSDNIAFTATSVDKLVQFFDYLQSGHSLLETSKLISSTQVLSQMEKHKVVALLNELDLFSE